MLAQHAQYSESKACYTKLDQRLIVDKPWVYWELAQLTLRLGCADQALEYFALSAQVTGTDRSDKSYWMSLAWAHSWQASGLLSTDYSSTKDPISS